MSTDRGSYTPLTPAVCATPDGTQIAAARGELIVVNKIAGLVQFYDATTQVKLAEIEMAKLPHEVVLSPDRRTAYVSIYGLGVWGKNSENPGREVAIIDLATRTQVGLIDVSPHKGPHGMTFDASGVLWVCCDVSGVILAVDVAARRVMNAVPTDSFGAHWLAATPDGKKLYASNKTFPFVCAIDTQAHKLIAKIPMDTGSEGLAVSPDGTRLYVMAQRPQQIAVIDTATDRLIEAVPLCVLDPTPLEKNPQKRVKVSPDGRYLLITSFYSGEIAIAPIADPHAQKKLAVEKGPMGITFVDANRAYVMNHDAGTISIVDVPNARLVGKFSTAPGPETLAIY